MILEKTAEPTATVTMTLTELKRISEAHGYMMNYLCDYIDDTRYKEHKRQQACVDSLIRAIE